MELRPEKGKNVSKLKTLTSKTASCKSPLPLISGNQNQIITILSFLEGVVSQHCTAVCALLSSFESFEVEYGWIAIYLRLASCELNFSQNICRTVAWKCMKTKLIQNISQGSLRGRPKKNLAKSETCLTFPRAPPPPRKWDTFWVKNFYCIFYCISPRGNEQSL